MKRDFRSVIFRPRPRWGQAPVGRYPTSDVLFLAKFGPIGSRRFPAFAGNDSAKAITTQPPIGGVAYVDLVIHLKLRGRESFLIMFRRVMSFAMASFIKNGE